MFKFQFPCLMSFGSGLTSMGTFRPFLAFLLTLSHFAIVDEKKQNIAVHGWVFSF